MDKQTKSKLRADAQRYRDIADRIESFIKDVELLESGSQSLSLNGEQPFHAVAVAAAPRGRFADMKQIDAIIQILKERPKAKTREIWTILKDGGIEIAKPTYVTSILSKHKEDFNRDDDEGTWSLQPKYYPLHK